MKDVMGIINVRIQDDILRELTDFRCIASVPFGGRYRLVDFILSSMANSGIQNVGVFTVHKYLSLMDHLGTGKTWDLNHKENRLFIFPPTVFYPAQTSFLGDIKSFYSHMDYFERSRQKDVIISPGNYVCNLDFREAVAFHRASGADITVFYQDYSEPANGFFRNYKLEINGDGLVLYLEEDPNPSRGHRQLVEIFIMSKMLLVEMIENGIMSGSTDLLQDVIIKNREKYKIFAYPVSGYFTVINSINRYYQANMDLLDPKVWQRLFFYPHLIYTKVKDEPPTKYVNGSRVSNSLLANGCLVEGMVENSILFRGVKVKKGALIRDSIVMQKSEIGEDACIENAILDKEVVISGGREVRGRKNIPLIIGKRKKL